MSKKNRDLSFSSPMTLLDRALSLDYFHKYDEHPPAIPFHRVDGEGRFIVIVGDNASGKSFFRRIVQLLSKENEMECIAVSVEGRRHIAYAPWLTFVYGDEETQATGVNSVQTVLTGITTCRGRDKAHTVFWDEPDLGLSDAWAAGIGQKFCDFALNPGEHTTAALIVTHSKALVRELLPAKPYYLHLGMEPAEAPQTLQEWVEKPSKPRDPTELPERSHARFRAIQRILDDRKP